MACGAGGMKGLKIYIATATADSATPTEVNADTDQAGYEALLWTEIGSVGNIGEFQANENMITYDTLSGVTDKAKGVTNAGDTDIEYKRNPQDNGQLALRTAGDTACSYAFKIEMNDAPTSTLSNTIFYTRGLVQKPKINSGGPDDFIRESATLALQQEAIKVDPA